MPLKTWSAKRKRQRGLKARSAMNKAQLEAALAPSH